MTDRPNIGEHGRLAVDTGGPDVVVCRDLQAFDELVKLAVADDKTGIAMMVLHSEAFLIAQGTKEPRSR
ncbi:MAG TPA: hypothetical protein VNE63_02055 [Candidatus Acidoferrales bacterium]|nr:hypothetical protein [Candidatus Acidoferrales bacterium]